MLVVRLTKLMQVFANRPAKTLYYKDAKGKYLCEDNCEEEGR